jgi:membrane-bound metal-dependent hydrolase YbcI (DUF457 family)
VFIGHFGVGLGAKRIAPTVSLGTLFLASQLADLVWPNLVLLGVESFAIEPGATALTPLDFQHYPYSHSLLATLLWGSLFAAAYALIRRRRAAAILLFLVVLSHWLLDVLTHRPDMPIGLDETVLLGLGLWNHPLPAIVIELLLFAAGTWAYAGCTRAIDRTGRFGFWALIIFLLVVYAANLAGPPPPSVAAVAWSAQAMWLIVLWAYWVDRHRAPRPV